MTTASSSPTARRRARDLRMRRPSGLRTPAPAPAETLRCSGARSRRRGVTAARGSSTPAGSCPWAPWSQTPRSSTTPAPAPPAPWAPGRWCNESHVTLCHVRHVTLRHITHCVGPVFVSPCLTVHVTAGHPVSHQELLPAREGAIPATGIIQDQGIRIRGSSPLSTEINKKQKTTRFFAQEVSRSPSSSTTSSAPSLPARTRPSTASPPTTTRTCPRWASPCLTSLPNPVTQFQASKFVTSTPVKSGPGSQSSRRRAGHMRQNVFPPPPPVTSVSSVSSVTSVMSPLSSLSTLATGNNIITFRFWVFNSVLTCTRTHTPPAIQCHLRYYQLSSPGPGNIYVAWNLELWHEQPRGVMIGLTRYSPLPGLSLYLILPSCLAPVARCHFTPSLRYRLEWIAVFPSQEQK